MNLNECHKKATQLLDEHGLVDKGWYFDFDTKATRRFGLCSHHRKRISMSSKLVELNEWETCRKTVIHEIAHALVGPGHGHNAVWKKKARELGDSGNRCYGYDVKTPPKRYIWFCVLCDKEYQTMRCSQTTPYSCGRCGGNGVWNAKYVLNVRLNPEHPGPHNKNHHKNIVMANKTAENRRKK